MAFYFCALTNLILLLAGIDDTVVDTYGHHLKQVKNKIISNEFVDFCSLPQILTNGTHKLNASLVEDTEVPHYLDTEIEEDSEFCRKILMAGCHTSDKILRDLIDSKNPAKVALYRGFTRFMEEDLALHRTFVAKGTKKGCMKIAKKCAFEMIKRNEAYSNLVELMFPHHLRLSIHAYVSFFRYWRPLANFIFFRLGTATVDPSLVSSFYRARSVTPSSRWTTRALLVLTISSTSPHRGTTASSRSTGSRAFLPQSPKLHMMESKAGSMRASGLKTRTALVATTTSQRALDAWPPRSWRGTCRFYLSEQEEPTSLCSLECFQILILNKYLNSYKCHSLFENPMSESVIASWCRRRKLQNVREGLVR